MFSMPNPTSKKHLKAKAFYLASLEVQMFYHNWYLVWDISQKEFYIYNQSVVVFYWERIFNNFEHMMKTMDSLGKKYNLAVHTPSFMYNYLYFTYNFRNPLKSHVSLGKSFYFSKL